MIEILNNAGNFFFFRDDDAHVFFLCLVTVFNASLRLSLLRPLEDSVDATSAALTRGELCCAVL